VDWDVPPDDAVHADADFVARRFGEPGCEILDARAEGSLSTVELIETPDASWRRGHVPHSLPVDFHLMVGDGGVLPSPEALRDMLERIGPRRGTFVDTAAEFIVYDDGCSGRGALGCLLLRMAGVGRVRYFRGGWPAWSVGGDRPVVRIIEAGEVLARLCAGGRSPADSLPPADFLLLDVRTEMGFAGGHIPGGVRLTASQMGDSLDVVLRRHWPAADPRRVPVTVYCWGTTCIRSRDGGTRLARLGLRNVEWFRGGLEAWEELGEPVHGSTLRRPVRPDSLRNRPVPERTGRKR